MQLLKRIKYAGCPACDAESDVETAPTCNLTGWIPARGAICGICSGPAGILDVIFVQKLVARITKAKTRSVGLGT